MDPSRPVLYPGEIEHLREQERQKSGIDVEDATWNKLQALAKGYGLTKRIEAVTGCRKVSKRDLKWNDALPRISVDPETYEVRADGEFLRAPDGKVIARHQNHAWYVGPQKFFCNAYADAEIYAHVDVDACLWYCHRDQRCWKEMVVVPAG